MASLSCLPDEIIILIAEACDVPGKARLARSNRRLNELTTGVLHRYSVQEEGNSAMYWAAEHGHIRTLQRMRSCGAELNDSCGSRLPMVHRRFFPNPSLYHSRNSVGFLPLHVAARFGQDAVVQWLLKNGARIESLAQSLCGCNASLIDLSWEPRWTPLHLAICNDNLSTAKLLISRGAALRTPRDPRGLVGSSDVLHVAAYENNTGAIEFLVGSGLAGVDDPDSAGYVALHYACSNIDGLPAVRKLLELGASLEIGGNEWGTPLSLACQQGFFEAALVLLEKGAVLDMTDPEEIWHNVTQIYQDAWWVCLDPTVPATDQGNAAWEGHREDFIRRLAQLGMSFDGRFLEYTPLTYAAAEDRTLVRTMQVLLDVGADVNSEDSEGRTPIFWILDRSDFDHLSASKVELLLRYGARLDLHSHNGSCAFDLALRMVRSRGDASVLEFIFQHSSMANFGDGYLDRVVANSYGCHLFNECRLLVRHGAALNVSDENLYADILIGIEQKNLEQMNFHLDLFPNQIKPYEMMEIALKHYKDANEDEVEIIESLLSRPEIGLTEPCVVSRLLQAACKYHLKVAIAQLLLRKGGDVNSFDYNWETPLSYAVEIGCRPMVKHLLLHGADPNLAPSDQEWSTHISKSPPEDYPKHLTLGDSRYRTPFMRAIDALDRHADTHELCHADDSEEAPTLLEFMLEHMPLPPIPQDPESLSYIHYALAWPESLRILLSKGADPNSCGQCARPPLLHYLTIAESMRPARPEALSILLEFGADIHRTDAEGRSFMTLMGRSTLGMANKSLDYAELELEKWVRSGVVGEEVESGCEIR